jgi:hypothetical protein
MWMIFMYSDQSLWMNWIWRLASLASTRAVSFSSLDQKPICPIGGKE